MACKNQQYLDDLKTSKKEAIGAGPNVTCVHGVTLSWADARAAVGLPPAAYLLPKPYPAHEEVGTCAFHDGVHASEVEAARRALGVRA